MGAPNAGGVGQNRRLSQITGYISKTVQDRRMVSIKVEFQERDAEMGCTYVKRSISQCRPGFFSRKNHNCTKFLPFPSVLYRAMLCIRGTSHGLVSVRSSVCLSVTSRCSTKTAKRRITQTKSHDTSGTLFFRCQRSPRNSMGRQMHLGWVKIGNFRQITGYISKTVQDRRMVSIKVE